MTDRQLCRRDSFERVRTVMSMISIGTGTFMSRVTRVAASYGSMNVAPEAISAISRFGASARQRAGFIRLRRLRTFPWGYVRAPALGWGEMPTKTAIFRAAY